MKLHNENLSSFQRDIEIIKETEVLRPRDLIALGIHPEYLRRLCTKGVLVRSGRGLYMPGDEELDIFRPPLVSVAANRKNTKSWPQGGPWK